VIFLKNNFIKLKKMIEQNNINKPNILTLEEENLLNTISEELKNNELIE
jgi:hypothetical protein